MYENAMRMEAQKLMAQHGRLIEVRCISPPPDCSIDLVFEDGHVEQIREPTGLADVTIMKFGQRCTGTECFHTFLTEAGFRVELPELEQMKGGEVLRLPGYVGPAAGQARELPLLSQVVENPACMGRMPEPGSCACVMVREGENPMAVMLIRAEREEFTSPLSALTPMSLHVHGHGGVYGVYTIIWQDPPFVAETLLADREKLSALMSQAYTYFLLVTGEGNLLNAFRVDYSPATGHRFRKLLGELKRAEGMTAAQLEEARRKYAQEVSPQDVLREAGRLAGPGLPPAEKRVERFPLLRRVGRWVVTLIALGALLLAIPATRLAVVDYARGRRGSTLYTSIAMAGGLFLLGLLMASLRCRLAQRKRAAKGLWTILLLAALGVAVWINLPVFPGAGPGPGATPVKSPSPGPAPTSEAAITLTPVPVPSVTPALATPTTEVVTYTVKAGDTLSAIAARFAVTVEELVKANNIENPGLIRVGQILIIPAGREFTPTPTPLP